MWNKFTKYQKCKKLDKSQITFKIFKRDKRIINRSISPCRDIIDNNYVKFFKEKVDLICFNFSYKNKKITDNNINNKEANEKIDNNMKNDNIWLNNENKQNNICDNDFKNLIHYQLEILVYNAIYQLDFISVLKFGETNKYFNKFVVNHQIWKLNKESHFWQLRKLYKIQTNDLYQKNFQIHMGRYNKMKIVWNNILLSQENILITNLQREDYIILDIDDKQSKWRDDIDYLFNFINQQQDQQTAESVVSVCICFSNITKSLSQDQFNGCLTVDFLRTLWALQPLSILVERIKDIRQNEEYKTCFTLFYSKQGEICINGDIAYGYVGYVFLKNGHQRRYLFSSFPYYIMCLRQYNCPMLIKNIHRTKNQISWSANKSSN